MEIYELGWDTKSYLEDRRSIEMRFQYFFHIDMRRRVTPEVYRE